MDVLGKPDRLERVLRFVTGALAGGGLWFFGYPTHWIGPIDVAASVLIPAGCGALALRFGDRFWFALVRGLGSRDL